MTTHDDGELLDGSASHGWKLGRGALFVTVEYRDRDDTNRAGADPRDQIVAGDAGNNAVAQPNTTGATPTRRTCMTFVNASFPLGAAGSDVVYALRRLQPARRLARRLLPPRPAGAELAADLSRSASCR